MENTCRSCGGILERVGNYNLCKFCGNKWMIDVSDDIRAVDRANAWSALRECDFEKATELFENIILKEKDCHESYWGRALAMAGIIYVNDMSEMKKVPTCNSISEDSFLECRDVKKAIELAPAEIAETYKKQAEQIEKIRMEWLEKARREPPYDVFISFKDSDRDKGIERTQDSVDAQDLYNGLVAEGFKVFFSRISLRNKVSEQYEPYIYNAIKTAKVMVVFGESPEYFNAVWIKNEWGRFKNRIEKGEKHKNSLVVAYKNMNPADLPISLRSRQCLNAAEMTFLPDLVRHIKRVIAETKQDAHLDRVEIKGGQISKKATKIANDTITTREIGGGAVAETDISEKQQLDLAKAYMRNKEWDDAAKLLDDLLFSNPTYAEALWCALMNKHCVTTDTALLKRFSSFDEEDFAYVEKVLNCADKSFAAGILDMLYLSDSDIDRATYLRVIDVILPYNYEHRDSRIKEIFKNSTLNDDYPLFKKMLSTLNDEDVDDYIEYNLQYAGLTKNIQYERECLEAVLSVDEGNIAALKQILDIDWSIADKAHLVGILEKILMYSASPDDEIISFIRDIESSVETKVHCEVVKEALRFYGGELADIKNALIDLAYSILDNLLFDEAEYFLNLALSVDPKNPRIYWGICLVKTRSMNEKAVVYSPVSIKAVPEYNKYLTMVDDKRRQECMSIAKRQTAKIEGRKKAKRAGVVTGIVAASLAVVILVVTVIIPAIQHVVGYNSAVELMNQGKYEEAISAFRDLDGYKDSKEKIKECKTEIEKQQAYDKAVSLFNEGKYAEALTAFERIKDYKDSAEKIAECENSIKYQDALSLMNEGKYAEAISAFKALSDFKDSADKISQCENALNDIAYEEAVSLMNDGKYAEAIVAFEAMNGYKDSAEKIAECKKNIDYNYAMSLMIDCRYAEAIVAFEAMNGYKDSAEKIAECQTAIKDISYEEAVSLMNDGKYAEAIVAFETLNGYKDSAEKIAECQTAIKDISYEEAVSLMNDGKYVEAIVAFEALKGYKDSVDKIIECETAIKDITYSNAVILMTEGKYAEAIVTFEALKGYKDSAGKIIECETAIKDIAYSNAVTLLTKGKYAEAIVKFSALNGYKDSANKITECELFLSLSYTLLNNNQYQVKGLSENAIESKNIIIPSIYEGKPVTSIGASAFVSCNILTSIVIPEGVTSIGNSAFRDCSSLTSIVIPESVTSIGNSAFYGCGSLTYNEYGNAYYLGNETNPYVVLVKAKSENITSCEINASTKLIYSSAFSWCTSLTSIVIPEGVTSIGNSVFRDCSSLTSIVIPDSVTSIGDYAFSYCRSLTSIVIPDSVTSIGDYAFSWCTSLTSIVIPEGVTSIGNSAFRDCSSLTSIVIPEGVTSIGNSAFSGCDSLTSIVIPESVTSIGNSAFCDCESLTSIVIPEGVTSIGYYAFYDCNSLTSIVIPDSVTSIGDYAFSWCTSLTSIVIPEGVTSIGDYAFSWCTSLTSIVIPEGVTSIGDSAFSYCDSLTSIVIPEGVTSIGDYAFSGCDSLESITVDPNNKIYHSAGNCLIETASKTLIAGCKNSIIPDDGSVISIGNYAFYYCRSLTSIVIPEGVTSIGNEAFEYCSSLTSIVIPESVTSIGNSAFYNCDSLTSIVIPESVTSIGNSAFEHCSSLTSIVIHDGVTSIGNRAFYDCYSLTSIVIPEGVTRIGDSAFYGCYNLTSIVIPEGVTSIGNSAFADCYRLKTVYYTGTKEEWASISIDSSNSNLKNTTIVYNYVPEE